MSARNIGFVASMTMFVGIVIVVGALAIGLIDAFTYSPAVEIAQAEWNGRVAIEQIRSNTTIATSPVPIIGKISDGLLFLMFAFVAGIALLIVARSGSDYL